MLRVFQAKLMWWYKCSTAMRNSSSVTVSPLSIDAGVPDSCSSASSRLNIIGFRFMFPPGFHKEPPQSEQATGAFCAIGNGIVQETP